MRNMGMSYIVNVLFTTNAVYPKIIVPHKHCSNASMTQSEFVLFEPRASVVHSNAVVICVQVRYGTATDYIYSHQIFGGFLDLVVVLRWQFFRFNVLRGLVNALLLAARAEPGSEEF